MTKHVNNDVTNSNTLNFLKWPQDEIENVHSLISVQEIDCNCKLFYKRSSKLRILHCCISDYIWRTQDSSLIHRLLENWRKIKYFTVTITSISIFYKGIVRKKNDRPTSLLNIDAEILKNILIINQILQYVKRVWGMTGTSWVYFIITVLI